MPSDHKSKQEIKPGFPPNQALKKTVSELETACLSHMAENNIPFAGPLKTDGKLYRFSVGQKQKKRDEFYMCHKWDFKGLPYLTCYYGTWKGGRTEYTYKSYDDNTLSGVDVAAFKREEELRQKAYADQQKKEKEDRLKRAQENWKRAGDLPTHNDQEAYLAKKRVKAFGVKYSINSSGNPVLAVPLRNIQGDIQAIQFIEADGDKRIHGLKRGNFHLLGEIKENSTIFVVEGYATGASVHEATEQPTVVAFDCGNIEPVVGSLRAKYKSHQIIIAADNDCNTQDNPGRSKAEAAAKKHNCSVVLPKFEDGFKLSNGKRPTDFNDLHVHFGIDEVKRQLELTKKDPLKTDVEDTNISQKEKEPVFKPFSFKELLTIPSKEWLLDQVFGARDIGMVYGSPGCGKTFIVIDMIINICKGGQWANCFNVNRCLNVAYCAGEGISGLPSRFATAAEYYNISSLHNFTFYKTIPQLFSDDNITSGTIYQFVAEWKTRQQKKEAEALDVLVIDTLHTAITAADENSAQDMGKVLQACRYATEHLGCVVLIVHHTNKGGTTERGSSALRGAMDFMIEIKRKSEEGTDAIMSCSKLKDGKTWQDQKFSLNAIAELDSVHVLWEGVTEIKSSTSKAADKNTLMKEMERYSGKRFTCKSLSEVIAKSEVYTRKLLTELEQDKKCKRELSDSDKPSSSRNPWVFYV